MYSILIPVKMKRRINSKIMEIVHKDNSNLLETAKHTDQIIEKYNRETFLLLIKMNNNTWQSMVSILAISHRYIHQTL